MERGSGRRLVLQWPTQSQTMREPSTLSPDTPAQCSVSLALGGTAFPLPISPAGMLARSFARSQASNRGRNGAAHRLHQQWTARCRRLTTLDLPKKSALLGGNLRTGLLPPTRAIPRHSPHHRHPQPYPRTMAYQEVVVVVGALSTSPQSSSLSARDHCTWQRAMAFPSISAEARGSGCYSSAGRSYPGS